MAKVSENDIQDMSQDWGNDPVNGLPFSGRAVQKFIKDTLGTKMGYFHYDTATNRYLVFANEESKDKYLENPQLTELVLGAFDAPFNYSAEVNLISEPYVAVPLGTTGNYIEFTFDTKNKNGASVGEDVVCTYTIMQGNAKKVVTQKYRSGTSVKFNVDGYLKEGANRITIGIVGQTTLAATTVGVTYQVVSLTLTDDTDITAVYDLSDGSKTLAVPFTVSGYGTKIVEWYLDGVAQEFDKNTDEVVDTTSSRIKYIPLVDLARGTHYIEFRAYTVIENEKFYSKVLHRDIIIENSSLMDMSPIIALAYEKEEPDDTGVNLVQYVPYDLRFAVHNPVNPVSTTVEVYLGNTLLTSLESVNGIVNTYLLMSSETGSKVIKLVAAGIEYILDSFVEETAMNIREITASLELGFSAVGRTNNSAGKGTWAGNGYTATLTGFNFTQTSGWVDNKLLLQSGASIFFDYAPLAGKSIETGKTLEFEFASSAVSDDTAVLCDLRNGSGTGILITACEAKITSRGGVSLSAKYKSEENTRISFVINKAAGATNKGLVFIYIDGILSGAANFGSSDDFVSDVLLSFAGTAKSEILLKQIRVYNTALSADQILNNYTLYRDTTEEMLAVYDRNDVYEEGTVNFSIDRIQGQLPVMLVTGDIPTLENTTNKDTQITVDIDYYNLQEPSRSFTMKGAAMRPQGTSSMLYPKKNFRIYTQKLANTVLAVNGKEVEDKLYAFKDGAQPVDCWCLKADFAESSGTHNTGIARLWNDVLFNSVIGGDYVFRTGAQKAALESGYPYDVRTTIDGFPILLFYRRTANDDPIFIGKYNFNNDKSTESVFGFTGIPGFDNSRMQCWEILNNGDALALFTDVSDFDTRWSDAFESRYPDTMTPNTGDLKAFSVWVNSMRDNSVAFAVQKWDHLNVFMLAAYYVYLMRFGAVDQVVKNAMLTSEDGQHFYFINYDNDTVNGLRNNGVLAFDPTIDRQSLDPATGGLSYAYAGHDSVLWNLLEGDEEFMNIVKDVDNTLYANGLSYDRVIEVFDGEQGGKWNERVYNQDAQHKYVGPYTNEGSNNLPMLQGKRQSHRRWWLSRRFSLYDSKFVSGDFKGKALEFKVINNTEPGWSFSITAGISMEYGWGVYNPMEIGVPLQAGESHSFHVGQTLNIGDPVRIYSAFNLQEVNLSNILPRLSNVELNNVWNETLGTQLKRLILGDGISENTILTTVSSIAKAKRIEYLDIRGCKGITTMDLSQNLYLDTLLAKGSGLTGITLAKGAPVKALSLPGTMQVVRLEQLTSLPVSGVIFEDNGANIRSLTVMNCPKLSTSISFPLLWLDNKVADDTDSVLYMDNVNWVNVEPEDFLKICRAKVNGASITLKGKIKLTTSSQEIIDTITEAFGSSVFRPTNELYVNAPDAIYLAGPDSILEGESAQFTAAVFSEHIGTVTYSIASGSRSGTKIDPDTGYLTSTETGASTSTLTIRAIHKPTQGASVYVDKSFKVIKRKYPESITIIGAGNPNKDENVYTWSTSNTGINGEYTVEWSLSGDITEYLELGSSNNEKCILTAIAVATETVSGTLTLRLKKKSTGATVTTVTKNLQLLSPGIIMTSVTNPEIMKIMYANGLAANETYMTQEEAEMVTDIDLQPTTSKNSSIFYNKYIKSFAEFEYFAGITKCPSLYYNPLLEISFPPSLVEIPLDTFYEGANITRMDIPEGVTYAGLNQLTKLESVSLPSTLKKLSFKGCTSLSQVSLPEGLEELLDEAFYTVPVSELILPDSLRKISRYAFSYTKLKSIIFPKNAFKSSTDVEIFNIFYGTAIESIEFKGETRYVIIDPSSNINTHTIKNLVFAEDDPYHFIEKGVVYRKSKIYPDRFDIEWFTHLYSGSPEIFNVSERCNSDSFGYISPNNDVSGIKKVILSPNTKYIDSFYQSLKISFPNAVFELPNENTSFVMDENGFVLDKATQKTLHKVYLKVKDLVIPESIDNFKDGRYMFAYIKCNSITWNSKLQRLIEQDWLFTESEFKTLDLSKLRVSVVQFGSETFKNSGIENIIFSENTESVATEYESFAYSKISDLEIPVKLYDRAFFSNKSLKNIILHTDTTEIPKYSLCGCISLKKIICPLESAPEAKNDSFGASTSSYVGRNTYNTGENILYVPAGATGYDTGEWSVLLDPEKCGFTISYTL